MSTSDDQLKQAFARRAVDARPTAECPPADRLWAAARGELIAETTQEVVLHTATCAMCAEAWRLAVDVAREAGDAGVARDARPAPRPIRRRTATWIAAGAALAAVAIVLVVLFRRGEPDPIFRGDPGAPTSLLDEGVPLDRPHAVLRWTPSRDASRYVVRVSSEQLEILWETTVTTTEVAVPEAALARTPPGSVVLWQVDALMPDRTLKSSATFLATIR